MGDGRPVHRGIRVDGGKRAARRTFLSGKAELQVVDRPIEERDLVPGIPAKLPRVIHEDLGPGHSLVLERGVEHKPRRRPGLRLRLRLGIDGLQFRVARNQQQQQ